MADYLHPSVSSQIVDNSAKFLTAKGVTQTLVVFTSDRGPDNVIDVATTESEFTYKYGEPNLRKHGQPAYNAMNWVRNHGSALTLRVMPDNAGYSHAVLNVQTKVGTKQVLSASGSLLDFSDVTVRTTVAHVPAASNSVAAIQSELGRGHTTTLDGFTNNMLCAFIPKGRGKDYDDLAVRLTLVDSFDQTYDFRAYNFEVLRRGKSGAYNTIEGPFLVSFDPAARDKATGQTRFIKSVVENYSDNISVVFNEHAYDTLGQTVNPNVHPKVLDFLSLKTRVIGGARETYFDTDLGKDVDVHIAVQKYTTGGLPVTYSNGQPVLNVVDAENQNEAFIVGYDNTYRSNQSLVATATVDRMKNARSWASAGTYGTHLDALVTVDGTNALTGGSAKGTADVLSAAKTSLDTTVGQFPATSSMADVRAAIAYVYTTAGNHAKKLQEALDYIRATGDSGDTATAVNNLAVVQAAKAADDVRVTKANTYLSAITTAAADLSSAYGDSAKIAAAVRVQVAAADAIAFANANAVAGKTQADDALSAAQTLYATVATDVAAASDPYLTDSDRAAAVGTMVSDAASLAQKATDSVNLSVLEGSLKGVDDTVAACTAAQTAVCTTSKVAKTYVGGDKAMVLAAMANNIATAINQASDTSLDSFPVVLRSYNTFLRFGYGSDGDLDESNGDRDTVAEELMVKAFKGLIDPNLTNRRLYPIDVVLDANYTLPVKNAIASLATEIRKDFVFLADTGFTSDPAAAVAWRQNSFQISDYHVAIFAQDFVVSDEWSGQDIPVTSTYFLASKIPAVAEQFGIHFPFVGPQRGGISGYKRMSWNPTEQWKEQLYTRQVNYVEADPRRTAFGSQITSQTTVSSLSDINNVIALLQIVRETEQMADDFKFQWIDDDTISSLNYTVNSRLAKWINNKACSSVKATVYSGDADRQQRLVRIKLEIVFNYTIERIVMDVMVNR